MQRKTNGGRTSVYTGKSRRHTRRARRDRWESVTAKLMICVSIVAAIMLFKTMFPGAADSVGNRILYAISRDVDYKAVLVSIGEAVSGERDVSEAFAEAYAYAFRNGSDDAGAPEDNGIKDAESVQYERETTADGTERDAPR